MGTEELSAFGKKVYEALLTSGASNEDKAQSVDNLVKASKLAKNMVTNALDELSRKGIAKRKAGEKRAGYYLIKKL